MVTLGETRHREGPQVVRGVKSPEDGSQSAKKVGKDFWEQGDLCWGMETELFERRFCRMSGFTISLLTSFCPELLVTAHGF